MEKLSKFQRIFFRLYYFLFVERFNKKFKETGELPPHLKKMVKDLDKMEKKYKII